jgi:hypothetical protein
MDSHEISIFHRFLEQHREAAEAGDMLAAHQAICLCHDHQAPLPTWLVDLVAEWSKAYLKDGNTRPFTGKTPNIRGPHANPLRAIQDNEKAEYVKAALKYTRSLQWRKDGKIKIPKSYEKILAAQEILKRIGLPCCLDTVEKAQGKPVNDDYVLRIHGRLNGEVRSGPTSRLQDHTG